MKPHEQRVIFEKQELDEKLAKLTMFIGNDTFNSLPSNEQMALERQCQLMSEYSVILGERIARFDDLQEQPQ